MQTAHYIRYNVYSGCLALMTNACFVETMGKVCELCDLSKVKSESHFLLHAIMMIPDRQISVKSFRHTWYAQMIKHLNGFSMSMRSL